MTRRNISSVSPLVLASCCLLAACPDPKPPTSQLASSASQLPPIRVDTKAKLLLTYFDPAKKGFQSASSIKDVPAGQRGWVRVVDLGAKPAARRDLELVYVADLRSLGKDGAYPYVVMSRKAFEEAAQNSPRAGATAKAPTKTAGKTAGKPGDRRVVLYATSWCPACAKAKKWLMNQQIPFVEKDIEKDRAAAAELMKKAQRAGIPASGVPVIDVNGTLVRGFDPRRITALLARGATKK